VGATRMPGLSLLRACSRAAASLQLRQLPQASRRLASTVRVAVQKGVDGVRQSWSGRRSSSSRSSRQSSGRSSQQPPQRDSDTSNTAVVSGAERSDSDPLEPSDLEAERARIDGMFPRDGVGGRAEGDACYAIVMSGKIGKGPRAGERVANKVVYVGETNNPTRRAAEHRRRKGKIAEIKGDHPEADVELKVLVMGIPKGSQLYASEISLMTYFDTFCKPGEDNSLRYNKVKEPVGVRREYSRRLVEEVPRLIEQFKFCDGRSRCTRPTRFADMPNLAAALAKS